MYCNSSTSHITLHITLSCYDTQRQILTSQSDGSYATGPTLVNYRFNYAIEGRLQVNEIDGPTFLAY